MSHTAPRPLHSNYGYPAWGCSHQDGTLIYSVPRAARPPLTFHAGTYRGVGQEDLLIDLADSFGPAAKGSAVGPLLEAWASSTTRPLLKLKWNDGSVPSLRRDHWLGLIHALLEGPYNSVYACCMGGHGRTGTFYAILGALLTELGHPGAPKEQDPVAWLRAHYCPEVVETSSQLDYIRKITGKEVKANPAKQKLLSPGFQPTPKAPSRADVLGGDKRKSEGKGKDKGKPKSKDENKTALVFGYYQGEFEFITNNQEEPDWIDYLKLESADLKQTGLLLTREEAEFLIDPLELVAGTSSCNWQEAGQSHYLIDIEGQDFLVGHSGDNLLLFWPREDY